MTQCPTKDSAADDQHAASYPVITAVDVFRLHALLVKLG